MVQLSLCLFFYISLLSISWSLIQTWWRDVLHQLNPTTISSVNTRTPRTPKPVNLTAGLSHSAALNTDERFAVHQAEERGLGILDLALCQQVLVPTAPSTSSSTTVHTAPSFPTSSSFPGLRSSGSAE
ncbi:hypothetical protein CHARACLAT_031378 [Characodon lateralis]|uniref:Secreted protein n=1 Tax=Characodon lateralis TaxID=208331 RepID=A0ABU7E559_9TELE|nr:hypothetical protein [Characodon lateralis]